MTTHTNTTTTGALSGATTLAYTFPAAYSVGFDRLFSEMASTPGWNAIGSQSGYPPHNIVKVDSDNYIIELAVAGFKQENLDIQLKDSVLTIEGKKEDDRVYTHKGISARDFTRKFTLGEYVQVSGATLSDGILAINLERVVPEEERPKKIEIVSSAKSKKGFLKD